MNASERRRVAQARVGRLATVRPDGRPHLVVVTFALLEDDTVVTAVDTKPKRTPNLQRLRNIASHPEVSFMVDHYDEDWARLWWVRLDGVAEVVSDEPRRSRLVQPLVAKYPQYAEEPPGGPAIAMTITSSTSWAPPQRGA